MFETRNSIENQASGSRILSSKVLLQALLALTVLLVFYVRWRFLGIPLERDEGEYAYAGQLLKQGIPPYSGVYNMKFPGTYLFYFLIELLFGQTVGAIRLGSMLINLLTSFFIYRLGSRLFNSQVAIVSTLCFLLLSLSESVEGIYANAEHFVLLFVLPGILVLLSAIEKRNFLKLFLSGVLLGLAVLMKQHGIAFLLFAFAWIFYTSFFENKTDETNLRLVSKRLLIFSAGIIVPLFITVLYLSAVGVLKNFWWLTFQYAQQYVAQNTWRSIWGAFSFRLIFKANPIAWTLCLAGIVSVCYRWNKPVSFFLLAFGLFSFLAICPGFFFRPHYFILILPAAALLTGAAFNSIPLTKKFLGFNLKNSFPILLILILSSFIFFNFNFLFKETPYEVSKRLHPKEHFNEMVEVSDYIRENSSPSDRIAVIGSEPEIYFYSKRRSATGYIYCYPLLEDQKYRAQMQQQYFAEIENASPKFVVLINTAQAWGINLEERDRIFEWCHKFLDNNYSLAGAGVVDWEEKQGTSVIRKTDRIEIYHRN